MRGCRLAAQCQQCRQCRQLRERGGSAVQLAEECRSGQWSLPCQQLETPSPHQQSSAVRGRLSILLTLVATSPVKEYQTHTSHFCRSFFLFYKIVFLIFIVCVMPGLCSDQLTHIQSLCLL